MWFLKEVVDIGNMLKMLFPLNMFVVFSQLIFEASIVFYILLFEKGINDIGWKKKKKPLLGNTIKVFWLKQVKLESAS